MMNCRGMGAARKPKKYAAGGAVEAPPASPSLGQRLRKLVGLETQGEKTTKRKTRLEQMEQDALKK